MYEPWGGCVWIHSNRVLTYHLLHWQRAMMDNPIIFYYTVAPLPPPQKYTAQMSNIRYFTMKVSKTNIWQTSIMILLNCFCWATIQLIRKALFMLFIVILNKKQSTPRSWGRQKARSSGSCQDEKWHYSLWHYSCVFLSKWNVLTLFLWPAFPWAQ